LSENERRRGTKRERQIFPPNEKATAVPFYVRFGVLGLRRTECVKSQSNHPANGSGTSLREWQQLQQQQQQQQQQQHCTECQHRGRPRQQQPNRGKLVR
jgi:hypothetical protein